jgi:hypothetical protein
MGGGALKLERIPRDKYILKKTQLNDQIIDDGRLKQVDILMWEDDERKDFGDIDLYFRGKHEENVKIAKDLFKPSRFVENGNVFSMDLEGIQVDIITVKNSFAPAWYNLALGLTIGRFFKRHGLTMGDNGLYIEVGPNKLMLTEDPEQFFRFIGTPEKQFELDHDRAKMIRAIYDSWIYDHDTNFPESKNSKQRKDSEHHFLAHFLDETSRLPKKDTVESRFEFALDYFNVREEYNQMLESIKVQKKMDDRKTHVKKILVPLIGEKGFVREQIGQKYEQFKMSIENFDEWIQEESDEKIKERLRVFLNAGP